MQLDSETHRRVGLTDAGSGFEAPEFSAFQVYHRGFFESPSCFREKKKRK
jgi:hypothetical protein